ncbi:alpha-1,4-N-acetylglucosaminyltransferase-like [Heptranchias perlo]|uniref:alpha-1,4-N-acetylglucosaminyltransferase-like n=1 Tax=Heptranchias perlo TaxID=212740 RepID=UPI00355A1FAE
MLHQYKGCLFILTIAICSVLHIYCKTDTYQYFQNYIFKIFQLKNKADPNLPNPTTKSGIIFVETTDKVEPTPLAVCSVESAARLNPDKRIYYFMKGFSGNLTQYPHPEYAGIPLLSSMSNVVLLPLNVSALFEDTPLKDWYQKVNPDLERFWIHVLADGCRLALLWKYGGIYLDTDIISMKPLPFANFTCGEQVDYTSNGAMGFHESHPFMWNCMEDFVAQYIGHIWGQQGPRLITRVLKRWCLSNNLADFTGKECNGISLWITRRFYPIPYPSWENYYASWKKEQIESVFSDTYGAHVWNYKNSIKKRKVIPGSGSLMEYLFQAYCPTTYRNLIQSRNNPESLNLGLKFWGLGRALNGA